MDSSGWIERFKDIGALWIHDGNPARPHALLTSGKHSNGFFNAGLVTQDPRLLEVACHDLILQINHAFRVNRVVGPAMGAITMAHEVARQLSNFNSHTLMSFVEKDERMPGRMLFKRTSVIQGESILVVEDVLTTGGSVEATIATVEEAGAEVLPWVLALVNRSGLTHIGDRQILSLFQKEMPIWEPDDCPLCKSGSEAIRPKDKKNWARLNATD